MLLRIGRPTPLGATVDDGGANFALLAPDATAIELCLFDRDCSDGTERRLDMYRGAEGIWHLCVEGVEVGERYGYRAEGPWQPALGHLFNPAKLLVDPRSRAISGEMTWSPALVAGRDKVSGVGGGPCPEDSAAYVPRSVVTRSSFDWGDDSRPRVPWSDTVIYECHVRGQTVLHPEIPQADRGRYAGLAHPAVVQHLQSLGATTVELMPVQHFVSEEHLQEQGLVNYWGYNPLAWMAPHAGYATADDGSQVDEFKSMVKQLHAAGVEVILDVVFNHSAEGDLAGPTLSLRGLANARCYRHDSAGRYADFTGCGNTLDLRSPMVRGLVLDSFRYWAEEMRVDGFRLDLAPALGRRSPDFDAAAPLFREISSDPELASLKWIAEPWDVGPGGYQLGAFPPPFREWNDRFRDTTRAVWRGDRERLDELVLRITGSPDLFNPERGPSVSVNYVTSHDGFSLADLTSYEERWNHANGEENRDGHRHTLSRNWGAEGDSEDSVVLGLRERARRNLIASLALSDGVPMLSHGDELGRSQRGNNNAYCQDNRITWLDWDLDAGNRALLAFVRRALALRRRWRADTAASMQGSPGLGWRLVTATGAAGGGWIDVPHGQPPSSSGLVALRTGGPRSDGESPLLLLNFRDDRSFRFGFAKGEKGRAVALSTFALAHRVGDHVELPPHSLLALDSTAPRGRER